MIKIGDSEVRDVSGISAVEEERIMCFFQGALYCWCNTKHDEHFSVPIFMGGENRDEWSNTPLKVLYDKHIREGKNHSKAWDLAGQEAGWILKKVVKNDIREFESHDAFSAREYHWLKK